MLNLEGVSLTELRKKLRELTIAKEANYKIPEPLIEAIKDEIRSREGLVEVWECSRCQVYFELMVVPTEMSCRCGRFVGRGRLQRRHHQLHDLSFTVICSSPYAF
jgi:hypothetical protein